MSKKQKPGLPPAKHPPGDAGSPYAAERPDGQELPMTSAALQREAAEPAEVLGRHRNSGQKDHKGAR